MTEQPSKPSVGFAEVAGAPLENTETPRGAGREDIVYITPDAPKADAPRFEGERYEALVPDTLDIAERADFAIHGLSNMADPEVDYELWIEALLRRNPPVQLHNFHDLNVAGDGFLEALPLMRAITGSDLNTDVDEGWMDSLLRMQGEDGLVYMPMLGRPWARIGREWLKGKGDPGTVDQLAAIHGQNGYIGAMTLYYSLTGDEQWKERTERNVDRMAELMVYKDDYCYYPIMAAAPGATVSPDMGQPDPDCIHEAGGLCAGHMIQALCYAYRVIGYQPALDLAGKLAVYLKDHCGCYDPDGRFLGVAHTHMHVRSMSGLLEYALLAKNSEMIEFCRKSYEYARRTGSPTVGYYPSVPGPDASYYDHASMTETSPAMEGCSAADMVSVAIKLSQGGAGDYWDDADRYIRNQFSEIQILRTDWVDRMIEDLPKTPVDEDATLDRARGYETLNPSGTRSIGAVCGVSLPNDISLRDPFDRGFVLGCCNINFSRAIPYLWDNILDYDDGTLRVNLLLNRASQWADVDSYIPYEGRVDVKVKQACSLSVRIPEWVAVEEVEATVVGHPRELAWDGRYAVIGEVEPGDVAALTFPISERTVKETMGYPFAVDYTLVIKGNTVVFIDPPGEHYPFYQRERYRENEVRWVKRQRFVSSIPTLDWHY